MRLRQSDPEIVVLLLNPAVTTYGSESLIKRFMVHVQRERFEAGMVEDC